MAAAPPSPPFTVRRGQPELIKPAKPTPHELKKLSDIDDQQGLRFQISFIMYYRSINGCIEGKDPLGIIRKALGEALVFYYPFAGRVVEGPNRKLMVDCNGEGILFIEADADISIHQLGDSIQPPSPFIADLLYDVPGSNGILACPLLLIQVTRLACGGFIFAVRLNHTMSDSLGLTKFLNATAEIARGEDAPSLVPVWQRQILCARNPPKITRVHYEYEDLKGKNSNNKMGFHQPNMVHSSVFFGPKDITSIRKRLPPQLRKCSTFELLAACLWKCRTDALEPDPEEIVGVSCMMNLRGKQMLQVPDGYYGNAFAFPAAITKAESLRKNSVAYAVELVKKSMNQMSEEYIRSVADLMVIKGRPHYGREWNLLIADTRHVGLADVDFGWGKAIYGGPLLAYPDICFFAPFTNRKGEKGAILLLCLPELAMKRFHHQILKMTLQSVEDFDHTIKPRLASML